MGIRKFKIALFYKKKLTLVVVDTNNFEGAIAVVQ